MSTRCFTVFEKEDGKVIAVMYRHSDGYPEGHGQDLASFLKGFQIDGTPTYRDPRFVNLLNLHAQHPYYLDPGDEKVALDIECLAAQIVARFKDKPGGIYLVPPDTPESEVEFKYVVSGAPGEEPFIRLYETHANGTEAELLFEGYASSFLEWTEDSEEDSEG